MGKALLSFQIADEIEAATLVEGLLGELNMCGVELGDDILGGSLKADYEDLRRGSDRDKD
jgi:hypothetical protein